MAHPDLHFRSLDDISEKSRRELVRETWNEHRTDSRAALKDLQETLNRKRDRLQVQGEAAWRETEEGRVERFYAARCRAIGMLLHWQEERGQPPPWEEAFSEKQTDDSADGKVRKPTELEREHARTVLEGVAGRDADRFETYASVLRRLERQGEVPPSISSEAVLKGAKRCASKLGFSHENGSDLIEALRETAKEGSVGHSDD